MSQYSTTYVVIADASELQLVKRHPELQRYPVIITGPGPLNVMQALQPLDRKSNIINLGYAGSLIYPVGTEVKIRTCGTCHDRAHFDEPGGWMDVPGDAVCLSSTDFVEKAPKSAPANAVFDMELAFIEALGFETIMAYKTISDKLDYDEYKTGIK